MVGINQYLQGAQKDGLIRVDLGANNYCAPPSLLAQSPLLLLTLP